MADSEKPIMERETGLSLARDAATAATVFMQCLTRSRREKTAASVEALASGGAAPDAIEPEVSTIAMMTVSIGLTEVEPSVR